MIMRILGRASVLLFLLLSVGCGPPANEAAVNGTVTYNGQPLKDGAGRVIFQKMDDPGRVYVGRISPESGYELKETGDISGALAGEYLVAIKYIDVESSQLPPPSLIPEQYGNSETSGLTATIATGENVVDFDLVDE